MTKEQGKQGQQPNASAPPRRATTELQAQPTPSAPTGAPKQLTQHQKQMLGSTFGSSDADRRRNTVLGVTTSGSKSIAELPAVVVPTTKFDGLTPAPGVATRELFRALAPPVTSVEGKREKAIYEQVLLQFAVGSNPRYEPDAPNKPRGHIFLWDVSRAMGCEVPHFVGPRELTLAQTGDWLKHEGPMRGWKRAQESDVYDIAESGRLVVVMPREARLKGMAVVAPQAPAIKPLVSGAGLVRGHLKPCPDVLGTRLVDFFFHD